MRRCLLAALAAAGCSSQPGLEVEVRPGGAAAVDFTSFRAAISRDTEPLEELRAVRPLKGPPWRLQVVSNGMTRGRVTVQIEGFRGEVIEATGAADGDLALPWAKLEVTLQPVARCLGYTQLLTAPGSLDVPWPEAGCRTLTARAWGGGGGDDCESVTGDDGGFATASFVLEPADVVTVTVGAGGRPGTLSGRPGGEQGRASSLLINGTEVLVASGGAGAEPAGLQSGLSAHACTRGGDGMIILSWEP